MVPHVVEYSERFKTNSRHLSGPEKKALALGFLNRILIENRINLFSAVATEAPNLSASGQPTNAYTQRILEKCVENVVQSSNLEFAVNLGKKALFRFLAYLNTRF
jgi:hypothetical protein